MAAVGARLRVNRQAPFCALPPGGAALGAEYVKLASATQRNRDTNVVPRLYPHDAIASRETGCSDRISRASQFGQRWMTSGVTGLWAARRAVSAITRVGA